MKGFQHNEESGRIAARLRLREERRIESRFEQFKRVAKAPGRRPFRLECVGYL